jgi:hypothetical protein
LVRHSYLPAMLLTFSVADFLAITELITDLSEDLTNLGLNRVGLVSPFGLKMTQGLELLK